MNPINDQRNVGDGTGFCRDFSNDIRHYLSTITLFVRLFSLTLLFFFILDLFFEIFSYYLSNYPEITILNFQLWRLLTTVLITNNFLSLVLSLFFWLRTACIKERSLGTVPYLLDFFKNSFLIETLYCILYFIVYLSSYYIDIYLLFLSCF